MADNSELSLSLSTLSGGAIVPAAMAASTSSSSSGQTIPYLHDEQSDTVVPYVPTGPATAFSPYGTTGRSGARSSSPMAQWYDDRTQDRTQEQLLRARLEVEAANARGVTVAIESMARQQYSDEELASLRHQSANTIQSVENVAQQHMVNTIVMEQTAEQHFAAQHQQLQDVSNAAHAEAAAATAAQQRLAATTQQTSAMMTHAEAVHNKVVEELHSAQRETSVMRTNAEAVHGRVVNELQATRREHTEETASYHRLLSEAKACHSELQSERTQNALLREQALGSSNSADAQVMALRLELSQAKSEATELEVQNEAFVTAMAAQQEHAAEQKALERQMMKDIIESNQAQAQKAIEALNVDKQKMNERLISLESETVVFRKKLAACTCFATRPAAQGLPPVMPTGAATSSTPQASQRSPSTDAFFAQFKPKEPEHHYIGSPNLSKNTRQISSIVQSEVVGRGKDFVNPVAPPQNTGTTSASAGSPAAPTASLPGVTIASPPGLAIGGDAMFGAWSKQFLKQKIVFPEIPTPAKTRDFQRDLTTVLDTASGLFDNSVVPWIQKVWANGTTFEDLAVSEDKFKVLDSALAGAAQLALKEGKPNVPFELARRVNKRADEAIDTGALINGRQYVWVLLDYLRTDSRLQTFYTVEHLTAVEWRGDANIEGFIDAWDRILHQLAPAQLKNIEDRPDIEPSIIQSTFAGKINLSKEENIRHALRQYNAAYQEGDASTYSYRYLRKAVDAAMERRHIEKQHAAQTKELNNLAHGSGNKLAAPALGAGGGGKGGDKGGKGQDKPKPTKEQKEANGPCYWHLAKIHGASQDGCFYEDACIFNHNVAGITKVQFEAMPKPERKSKGKGKGKGKGRSQSPSSPRGGKGGKGDKSQQPCLDLLHKGKCERENCQYSHSNQYKNVYKKVAASIAAKAKATPAVAKPE